MEATTNFDMLALFGVIIQWVIVIAIILGLIRLTRKRPVLRWILLGLLFAVLVLAIGAYFIFKDMGKGWAL